MNRLDEEIQKILNETLSESEYIVLFDFKLFIDDIKQDLVFSDKLRDVPKDKFNRNELFQMVLDHLVDCQVLNIDSFIDELPLPEIDVNEGDVTINFGQLALVNNKITAVDSEADQKLCNVKVTLHCLVRHDEPLRTI